MNYNNEKIVEFQKYCNEGCKNWEVDDDVEGSVCDICLSHPVNLESERPVNYEPKWYTIVTSQRKDDEE